MSAMKTKPHGYGFFLGISTAGAFVTAFAFVVVLYYSLPPTDLARGLGLMPMLGDPFVLAVALPVATLSGLLASPLLFFALRRRRLLIALPIVFVSVLTVVVALTPFLHLAALAGAFIALIISTAVCRMLPITFLQRTAAPTDH